MANSHEPWFILTPRADDSYSWIDFRDNLDHRGKLSFETECLLPPPPALQGYGFSPGLWRERWFVPENLFRLLNEAIAQLPEQQGPHATGPTPLPLFINVLDAPWPALPWEDLLTPLLTDFGRIDANRYQLIRLARRRWEGSPPLDFPLRVMAVGQQQAQIFDRLQQAPWYLEDEAIQQYGINFTVTETPAAGAKSLASQLAGNHLIICDPEMLAGVLAAAGATRAADRPRVFVIVDRDFALRSFLSVAEAQLPPRTSMLWLPTRKDRLADVFFKEFMEAVTHDYSLHEAVKSAVRQEADLAAPPLLVSDPRALRSLRLNKAVSALVEKAFALESQVIPGDVRGFLDRVEDVPTALSKQLREIAVQAVPLQEAVEQARSLDYRFDRETKGFAHAAKAAAALDKMRPQESNLWKAYASLAADPASREMLSRHQHRYLDVTLKRRYPRAGQDPFVLKNEPIHPRRRYQLRVQIGRRLPASLVVGEAPPLDPLLPEPEPGKGHLLHVAVFTGDFRLLSPILKPLVLPELGASDPIFFDLLVPRRTKPGHKARLRLCLYYDLPVAASPEMEESAYHNYLLQSFGLEALVEADEKRWFPSEVTKVELEFSRTSRFANLQDATPRLVSLGLNQGPQPGTHQLTIKRGGTADVINLTEKLMEDNLKTVRSQFEAASRDPQNLNAPRFPEGQVVSQRKSSFDQVLRELARTGRTLYRAIWERLGDAMQQALGGVAASRGQIIQVARFDSLYLFPWAILYDFFLPPDIVAQPDPEVCRGFIRKAGDHKPFTCEQCLDDCLHPNKEEVFCVYGFWGTRHQVEQVLHTPKQTEDAIRDLAPIATGAVGVALGLSGKYLDNLVTDLTGALGQQWVQEFQRTPDILEVLWTDEKRPAILVIVSHYQRKDVAGQPRGPRIQVPGRFLQPADITEKVLRVNRKWESPHSVVLLVACESAADDLATLGSFLNAFATARAGAVVGTESTIFTSLAARFSKEMAADLLNTVPLGKAILGFRRKLLQELNPLGFVFTAYGDAELVRK